MLRLFRRTFALAAMAVLAGLLTHVAARGGDADLVDKKAPELNGDFAINGKLIQLADLKGKIVLLEFWAPGSGPCRAMLTPLSEWHEKYSAKGLVILGVTTYYKDFAFDKIAGTIAKLPAGGVLSKKEEQQMLKDFVAHHDLKYSNVALAEPAWDKARQDYGITKIPTTVLIDANGIVQMVRVGTEKKKLKELGMAIEKMVEELQK